MIKFDGINNNKKVQVNKRSSTTIKKIILSGILVLVILCSGHPRFEIGVHNNDKSMSSHFLTEAQVEEKLATKVWFAEKIADMLEQDYNQEPKITFTDVDYNKEYSRAINVAVNNGILTGYNDETFGVNNMMTFEEVIVSFCRRYGIEPINSVDNPTRASDWAKNYIAAVLELDLINDVPFDNMQDIVSKDVVNFMGDNFLEYYRTINKSENVR